jgi:hypothetical protein
MTRLAQILEDVLERRRVVSSPSTFRLLRRFAPHRTAELATLQAEAVVRKAETPAPVAGNGKGNGSTSAIDPPILLTRNEVQAILSAERPASVDEIEWLLAHADHHEVLLSETEEMGLRNIAARLLANKHVAEVRRQQHNEEFIAQTLGTYSTQYGDLAREDVTRLEAIRVQGLHAIQKCIDHRREKCSCWRHAREALFELRCIAGEGSPIAMAALAVWNSIEDVARSGPRVEHPLAEQEDGPPGIIYNWRHFRSPEYMKKVY